MSAAGFTPGPWRAEGRIIIAERDGEELIIGDAVCLKVSETEADANANVFAAAHDLYDAARGALVVIDALTRPEGLSAELAVAIDARRAAITAAIAKAEGRS